MRKLHAVAIGALLSWVCLPLTAGAGGPPSLPGKFNSQRGLPGFKHDDAKKFEKFWTAVDPNTGQPLGPSYADILVAPENFVPCRGGPFALCYYSGPDSVPDPTLEPLPCELSADGRVASCKCLDIPFGVYFVDIHAILDFSVYLKTVDVCGADGSGCAGAANLAPVCEVINQNRLFAGADRISTFSFDCAIDRDIGQTSCHDPAPYAGCMTAPCVETGEPGFVECQCPVYTGPFQVGQGSNQMPASCDLGSDLVWSAANNVNEAQGGTTFPDLSASASCTPDLPEEFGGCPLLARGAIPSPPAGTDCAEVCDEYLCLGTSGAEVGFTCDATLCTATCDDKDLVAQACSGLGQCPSIRAIARLEEEVGCSCCASQICGCEPSGQTNAEIHQLVQEQMARGIDTQCEQNGTLCGSP
jgi:hypothetical protein